MTLPRISIRLKLAIGSLVPIVVVIVFCAMLGVYLIKSHIAAQAQEKVRIDLNTAREVYQTEVGHVRDVVRFTADHPLAAAALAGSGPARFAPVFAGLKQREHLDLFTLVDRRGRVVLRAGTGADTGEVLRDEPLVARALAGETVSGTELFTAERLRREGDSLDRRATIPLVATLLARPGTGRQESRGMLLVAAAPVRNTAGTIIGAIYGGVLLNNTSRLVDKIKQIVYEGVQFKGDDLGTATLFLDDVRIATNVKTPEGRRAIGTRLSSRVYERVIVQGEKWVDRAFVVKEHYFSAYEPIRDISGNVAGSLYVGLLTKPYLTVKRDVYLLFGGIMLAGSLLGLAVSGFISIRLTRPIQQLTGLVTRFSSGERGERIEITDTDEVGDLAEAFNSMSTALSLREEENRSLNRHLEEKVRERTAELEEKNQLLIKTREELARAAKLAAVGKLAAGVAHEINNPMAIIRGNAELLQLAIPSDHPGREEVNIIAQQVGRVEQIVTGLLQFARKERRTAGPADVRSILEQTLAQISHQAPLDKIAIQRDYADDLPELEGDSYQLRQVFTNLILNAIQAMPDGGVLTVAAMEDDRSGTCRILVSDTGPGIATGHLEQLFSPFFTTKPHGTGLGLAVSYGIIKEHGGDITVTSTGAAGTTFCVTLPLCQPPL